MTELINMTDEYETEKGDKARVICIDALGDYPVIALITDKDGSEYLCNYTAQGRFNCDKAKHSLNLVKVEPVKELTWWVDKDGDRWNNKSQCEYFGCIGSVKLKIQGNKLIDVGIVELR